jgi:hypothetical protein
MVYRLATVLVAVLLLSSSLGSVPAAQADRYASLDKVLDTYVRDGRVYYRALKSERALLDRFVQALDLPADQLAAWPTDERKAFWLNAYDALVLTTVIDAYPIRGSSTAFPRDSVRQIPGGVDRTKHRVAGVRLTLDEIEDRMTTEFADARMLLAIGRGANGGGRLRSEVFRGADLTRQLDEAVKECTTRAACVSIDLVARTLTVNPLFGWRSAAFERTFVPLAAERWSSRTPLERAIAAMIFPHMFSRERELLTADTFRLGYGQFDWSLNEL